jgi:hypothetical protein
MCLLCVLLDATPLIPLTITASEYPINFIENSHVEATQPQLPPSNARKQYDASLEQGKELGREVHTVIILQERSTTCSSYPHPNSILFSE